MRRLVHNTTALAACLSLLAPHFALANVSVPAEPAVSGSSSAPLLQLTQATDAQPSEEELRKLLRKEKKAEKAAKAAAAEGKDAKADKPKRADKANAKAEGDKPAKKAENVKDDTAAADPQNAPAPAKKREKPRQDAVKANDDDAKATQNSARAEGKDQKPQQQKAEAKDRKAQQQAEAKDQKPQGKKSDEDDLRKALEQKQADTGRDQAKKDAAKAADGQAKAAAGAVVLAGSDRAQSRGDNMGRLSSRLEDEVADGLTEDRLGCVSGGAFPCKDGDRLMTPGGVVLDRNDNGRYMLAPESAQMFRVDGEGDLVRRAAEESAVQTEAAKEAARQTRADKAAALDDRQTRRDIREQRITAENRRSSAEEFADSLSAALGRDTARRDNSDNDDDDDDNDTLVKALLLGAGALAVGSMLNNNRQVALSTPDRVVVTRADGSQELIKDETALLRQPGSTITTEEFDDGSSRTVVTRADGSKVVTIRDADLRILRRTLVSPDGLTTRLIDDTETVQPVELAALPAPATPIGDASSMDEAALRAALQRDMGLDRSFSLSQIRNIPEVRALVAPVDIDAITFDTGSAAISPDQAQQLSSLGNVIDDAIARNPREMFLIEGHTDTVGDDAMNLALSDRRAESVALALTEYFDVPPENLVVQGYGEQYLKVRTEGDVRVNRRASVRRITDLLRTASAE